MALPAGSSKVDASWVHEFRLERRIRLVSVRQFLTANAISVPDDVIEQVLRRYEEEPAVARLSLLPLSRPWMRSCRAST